MKQIKNTFNKDILTKVVIFVVTVSVIVYFLPRNSKFNYQFELNKPWKYGQLIATFDFPIYKDEHTAQKEQDSLLRHFQPYFEFNKEIEKEVLNNLKDNYNSSLRHILPSTDYVRYIEKMLKEIYQAGVITNEDVAMLHRDSTLSIRVIEKKETTNRYTDGLFTIKEAYEYILSANPKYDQDILRQAAINEYIYANLVFDKERSEAVKDELFHNFSWAKGMVQSGQKIIDRGEIVSKEQYQILESLRKESSKRSAIGTQKHFVLFGHIGFVASMVICLMLFIQMFRKDYYQKPRSLMLMFILIIFLCLVTSFMMSRNFFNVYIVPYAILPIIVRVFLDSRTAFISHVITILICSITLGSPYEFLLLQLPAGLVAIYSLRELSQRSQLFNTAFLIVLTYCVIYFSYELVVENDLADLNRRMYIYFIVNGIFLLFAYPFLYLFEKVFGFTSNVTLVELSNINTPLLRRLSETAPGTFQHSMQVANLAAEAAIQIGAKSQLVRTGALYHDIGKLENPAFFTENQQGGLNPHSKLSYEQSAQIVINHVKDGLKLAEKNNLPRAIKNFISTHHGKGKTKYFYISWKNEHSGEEPDEAMFTYPGPNPFSKETAILMMADAVEAASRSLPEYTEESIEQLVEKIIDGQVNEGYFRTCPITFQDIEKVKEVFKNKLMTTYHTRISYPELNQTTK
ncbi:HDIG domain-containing protein [Bacteroides sp. 214]|uniref:HD family phosphohydrolase n=1 Tax=Bacteroides sp. 214 TaxID=2302935 RepID=UPI0013D130ED|nr:HDIG domain-containing metalloprotein [Bacteroides sp. 214]NDW13287.1 HDIG domain-containing protein [Bacteroides sp. 214]